MRVCLLTPGQPSTNPRLVKEADALTEAGYQVHVLCSHWASWAREADEILLASRRWSCAYVGGDPIRRRARYRWTRLRHGLSRRVPVAWCWSSRLRGWALCRVLPELARAAKATVADLYVAHSLGALPAAVDAAETHGACAGFDAEDFHSGERSRRSGLSAVVEDVERRYLLRCDYVTAGSPGIAAAYAAKYGIPKPVTILNVFPLAQRPAEFRSAAPGGPLTLYWFSQTIGADRGLEDVVRAMGRLRDCQIELHLRGDWQPGYRARLLELAATAGVRVEQIVAHAPEPSDEMVRLASLFDVGLAPEPGRDENNRIALSNKIFTYLLAGNAVVATATDGQRPVMEAIGDAGFCYDPGHVGALAACLRAWFEDRAALERARCRAWEWGTREYNWEREKEKFLRVVGEVLAPRKGHPPLASPAADASRPDRGTRAGELAGARILVIMPSIPILGMEHSTLQIMRMMRERGADVRFITYREYGRKVRREAERIGCSWRPVSLDRRLHLARRPGEMVAVLRAWVKAAWQIDSIYRRYRPTHIYVTNFLYFLFALPTLWRARKPVVFRLPNPPDTDLLGVRGALSRWLWRYLVAPASDVLVCNSRYTLSRLERIGVTGNKARVIYNCLPERPRAAAGDAPKVDPYQFNVVYLGQIRPGKGVRELFDVALRLVRERGDVSFYLVGEHKWQNPFAEGLLGELKERDLVGRINILDEIEDVGGLLAQCDLHVCPSVSPAESFPNVVLEAKSQGVPSVVFPTAGLPESVTHLVDGYVCRDTSLGALYDGIRYFLDDPESLKLAGEAARRSLERFPRERIADQWAEVFKAVRV